MGTRRSLSFTDKTQSAKGILSIILGIMSAGTCVILVVMSFVQQGNAGSYVGSTALVAIITAGIGLGYALAALKEEETKRTPIIIGLLLNLLILCVWVILFINGIKS